MKYNALLLIGMLFFSSLLPAAEPVAPKHGEVVRERTQKIVPYALDKTQQTFSKTVHGGVQHVVAKSANDAKQIQLIQAHLQKMVAEFRKGDFSATEWMHGSDMPGLMRLKKAEADDVRYEYKALPDGGQIHYSSEYPELVQALHEWFDAQVREHGSDMLPGHGQHHSKIAE